MAEPQQGVAYVFYVTLFDVANPGRLKLTPTIATGDFKRSTDDGALTNLSTLPAETPAGSGLVKVSLSAAEMGSGGPATGSKVNVRWSDPEGEWTDGLQVILAPPQTITSALTTLLSTLAAGVTLTAAALTAVADAWLDRNMGTGTDSGSTTIRTPRQALRFLRNRWTVVGTTLTVYKENDSTVSHTTTLTGSPGADPVVGSDPAGP